jgi:hypothetical protein
MSVTAFRLSFFPSYSTMTDLKSCSVHQHNYNNSRKSCGSSHHLIATVRQYAFYYKINDPVGSLLCFLFKCLPSPESSSQSQGRSCSAVDARWERVDTPVASGILRRCSCIVNNVDHRPLHLLVPWLLVGACGTLRLGCASAFLQMVHSLDERLHLRR